MTTTQKKASIKTIEKQIEILENGQNPYYARANFFIHSARVGDIGWVKDGRLGSQKFSVVEIVDSETVIAKWQINSSSVAASGPIERGEGITFNERTHEGLCLISGVPTASMDRDRPISFDGVFAVTEKTIIDTASGENHLWVLENVNMSPHASKFMRTFERRTWKSQSGHAIEASFVEFRNGKVTLLKSDKTFRDVKLSDLSSDDRKYVRERIQEMKVIREGEGSE